MRGLSEGTVGAFSPYLLGPRDLNPITWSARTVQSEIRRPGACLKRQESMNMAAPTQEQIIHRAYELWEQAGKPEGRDQEFYHQAEKEFNDGFGHEPTVLPG